jgi:hypothetical protein
MTQSLFMHLKLLELHRRPNMSRSLLNLINITETALADQTHNKKVTKKFPVPKDPDDAPFDWAAIVKF